MTLHNKPADSKTDYPPPGKKELKKTAMMVRDGISMPANVNPAVSARSVRRKRKIYSVSEYIDGIASGNMTILSQAITLVESTLPAHYEIAQEIIEKCLPLATRSVRVGITGIPGVGKSTFIETFGLHAANNGKKIAVLAIDPSSEKSKGSILGDKTRMELLSVHPNAYIRPSPSAGTLGGVARKTRETIILCEAAGFDTILVETVGVGQSETAARSMVDFFLLLMLSGAGDELQGIKRGIMEMADAVAVTKADGDNMIKAENTRNSFRNAVNLFPLPPSGWKPVVVTCSAQNNSGISELWAIIGDYIDFTGKTGYFDEFRRQQAVTMMHDAITERLYDSFYNRKDIKLIRPVIEKQLFEGTITSYKAARILLDKYFEKRVE